MRMKRLSIIVKGHKHEWSFTFTGDPSHLDDWRNDGLEVYEVINEIPEWLPSPLIRLWIFIQDIINFKLPKRH